MKTHTDTTTGKQPAEDAPITESPKIFQLRVFGKTVKILRTEEEAQSWLEALCDDPGLFTDIQPWEPGWMMPFVKFDGEAN